MHSDETVRNSQNKALARTESSKVSIVATASAHHFSNSDVPSRQRSPSTQEYRSSEQSSNHLIGIAPRTISESSGDDFGGYRLSPHFQKHNSSGNHVIDPDLVYSLKDNGTLDGDAMDSEAGGGSMAGYRIAGLRYKKPNYIG